MNERREDKHTLPVSAIDSELRHLQAALERFEAEFRAHRESDHGMHHDIDHALRGDPARGIRGVVQNVDANHRLILGLQKQIEKLEKQSLGTLIVNNIGGLLGFIAALIALVWRSS